MTKKYRCDYCGKEFNSLEKAERHEIKCPLKNKTLLKGEKNKDIRGKKDTVYLKEITEHIKGLGLGTWNLQNKIRECLLWDILQELKELNKNIKKLK